MCLEGMYWLYVVVLCGGNVSWRYVLVISRGDVSSVYVLIIRCDYWYLFKLVATSSQDLPRSFLSSFFWFAGCQSIVFFSNNVITYYVNRCGTVTCSGTCSGTFICFNCSGTFLCASCCRTVTCVNCSGTFICSNCSGTFLCASCFRTVTCVTCSGYIYIIVSYNELAKNNIYSDN